VKKDRIQSKLLTMTQTTRTALWNDSCSIEELTASISDNGAVGATCNPVIVLDVLRKEFGLWKSRIEDIINVESTCTDYELAWRVVEEMSIKAAKLLEPIYHRENGRNGRLSIQTDPRYFRDARRMVEQAERFNALAPNMIVKIPATAAGIEAIEEATWRGISINATVSFTVSQTIAVAEAVERGLERREKVGKVTSTIGPVCTLMVGRLDDWLKAVSEKKGTITNPGILDWAGVAAMKKAYSLYQKRGYRLRLLSAAFRNHLQWSELIGGDIIISPPFEWQKRFNASSITVEERINNPVPPEILEELLNKCEDFGRAYQEMGIKVKEFDSFGATRRTLRQFNRAVDDLTLMVRDAVIPNPDL
jgi:transaldolase